MNSKATIVVRKKPNKKGLFPLAIRITKNRKSTYLYIGHYINLKDWDEKKSLIKKSHPNSSYLNHLLISKLAEANKTLLQLQFEKKDISANQIKKELKPSLKNTGFFDLAEGYLTELENDKKLSRLSSDKPRVKHVLTFTKSKQLTFQEIDEVFLKRFRLHLKKEFNLSERSIINNFIVIRTLYNRAIKLGIADRKLYPFGADKIKIKFPETEKIGLTTEEIRTFANINNLSASEQHARNVWLFCFYLAGIRVADVLKIRWSDIYDGRLHYRMNKNSKLVSLKLPDKILPILNNYLIDKSNEDDFIFPELKDTKLKDSKDIYNKTKAANKKFNKHLSKIADMAKINKKLTMHIARHSFGHIAGDRVPIQILQQLYRHSSVTTTMMYQSNFINKATDEALGEIVDF